MNVNLLKALGGSRVLLEELGRKACGDSQVLLDLQAPKVVQVDLGNLEGLDTLAIKDLMEKQDFQEDQEPLEMQEVQVSKELKANLECQVVESLLACCL